MAAAALSVGILSLLALAGFATWAAYQLRRVVPQRLQRLEDALRVYNSANAALGRQVAEFDDLLRSQRATGAAPAPTTSPAPAPVGESPARRGPAVPSAAERYGAADPEPEYSEAELRLAQLIKSRLSTLRVN